ncbi:Ankyrin repeat protein 2 [Giardia muris]|uniref:Ankyrin repeat protein 2 n=1 Tax=Giardia muris TaxID=5742 RepID=A0A4Z1SXV1_GIAMU|nr:Ankyrin repeat protein 2 [Giardia muris]|eukprot:TNJ30592.1 Ankyrin repeat protein 2 [Giardia muris]
MSAPPYVALCGDTALMRAAATGDVGRVRTLASSEAGLQNAQLLTALMHAVIHDQPQCIEPLLREVRMRDIFGRTALMYAARTGHNRCTKLLVEQESGLTDDGGWTALIQASALNEDPPDELIRAEAGYLDRKGNAAIVYASLNRNAALVNKLIPYEREALGVTSLMAAAAAGDHKALLQALSEGATLRDVHGKTALMYAASSGSLECVRELLSVEGGCRDKHQGTALMYAAANCMDHLVPLLAPLEAGALDERSWSALMYAVTQEHLPTIKALLPYEYMISDAGACSTQRLSRASPNAELHALLAVGGLHYIVNEKYKDRESELGLCIICLNAIAVTRCTPCAHACACLACAERLVQLDQRTCPLCRGAIIRWEFCVDDSFEISLKYES